MLVSWLVLGGKLRYLVLLVRVQLVSLHHFDGDFRFSLCVDGSIHGGEPSRAYPLEETIFLLD